jgi:hypothetical protein
MARGGFFRRLAQRVTQIVERFTAPEDEPPTPQPTRRARRVRRTRRAPRIPDYTKPPSRRDRRKMPTPPDIGEDWTGEWLNIDLGLIEDVVTDLLADLEAAGYL